MGRPHNLLCDVDEVFINDLAFLLVDIAMCCLLTFLDFSNLEMFFVSSLS